MEEKDRRCPRGKLHCFNWLEDIPGGMTDFDIVEVQFKNTRKGFYRNSTNLDLAPAMWWLSRRLPAMISVR